MSVVAGMPNNGEVSIPPLSHASDTSELRKARGAFFTPEPLTYFITNWAVRSASDRVMEPSAGDAAFLVEAVRRLNDLGAVAPTVAGVEIHAHSARITRERITEAGGGTPNITHSDFFLVDPSPSYDAVVGNPPYIRYQDFTGGTIPGHRIGGSWIIFKAELLASVESRSEQVDRSASAPIDVLAGYGNEMTYKDLIVCLGKTKQTIYTWLREGTIPAYLIGDQWVIHTHQVRRMLEQTSNQQ